MSLQPGDNYRVLASLDTIESGQYVAIQNDGTSAGIRDNYNNGARVRTSGSARTLASGMLTVWRRLHVEVDSMGVVGPNYINGMMTIPTPPTPGATAVTIRTDQDLPPDEAGRFNGGTLSDGAGNQFVVVSHTTGPNFQVTVSLGGAAAPTAGLFVLRDDDVLVTGTRLGDPDTSTLASALTDAYMVPLLKSVGHNNPNVAFDLNVEDGKTPNKPSELDQIILANWESRSLNVENFWVTYLLAAYQGPTRADGDPDTEPPILGITSLNVGGALIFKETLIDYVTTAGITFNKEADTVVHEIGHAVARSSNHPVTLIDAGRPSVFTPWYLHLIRSTSKPAG